MPYIPFTEEQKRRANSVDLAEYLRRRGEKLIPSGPEYRLASDHSVTVRGREWYDHEAREGGGPVSFLQTFHDLSYVALCGTSEQAMLWMLEQEPRLRTVRLCLDHDAAGIEAAGRLADALRERGYEDVSVLRPEYKDWAEDLKARNGLDAQPAEEHPQLEAAEEICGRIAAKCRDNKPDQADQQVQKLFSH